MSYSPDFEHLTYVDESGIRRPRFEGFGSIGISAVKSARMNFALNQRLQAKLKKGDQIERLDNLVSFDMSGSYNFLWREQNFQHPLSTINSSIRIQPPGTFGADLSWTTDVYSERPIRAASWNAWVSVTGSTTGRRGATDGGEVPLDTRDTYEEMPSEPWNLSLAFSSSGGYQGGNRWVDTRTLNGVAHYELTRGWKLGYSASYDVTQRQVLSQRFALVRDLHCWQASFTRSFAPDGEAEYYFKLGIKEQKEIYIERGTRETSFGGIR
jgi:hypothetical protein